MPIDLTPYRAFIAELAAESGEFIRPYFGCVDLAVEAKGDASPVTAADRGAEELIRRRIEARFPEHGIIGEELGNVREDAEFVWVLDPIDGTKWCTPAPSMVGWAVTMRLTGRMDTGDSGLR